MTEAFSGQLFWMDEQLAFSRIVVDSLEFPENEDHVLISLRSRGDGMGDNGHYEIMTRASPPERFEYYDHNNRRVIPTDPRQKVYRTNRCQTSRHDVVARTILELRFRLLSDENKKRFCFVRLDWIDDYDPNALVYSAQGLLEQCEAKYGDNFSGRSISC